MEAKLVAEDVSHPPMFPLNFVDVLNMFEKI
jgi:hypothetical protein